MSINSIRIEAPVIGKSPQVKTEHSGAKESFSEIYKGILGGHSNGGATFADLNVMQNRIMQGGNFAPRDLLMLQIQMGRFNFQVEMVSKVAEAANATIRRLQGS